MRCCVVGPGAIGGFVAASLAHAGHEVAVVARSPRAERIARDGIGVRSGGEAFVGRPRVAAPERLGRQDVVFLTTKAHGLVDVLPAVRPLVGADTLIVPMINGIPYWYFLSEGGAFAGSAVRSVDPQRHLIDAFDPARTVGAVLHISAEEQADGAIAVAGHVNILLGAINGQASIGLRHLAEDLTRAGLHAIVVPAIRDAVWAKVQANIATNPLSAVAGATLDELLEGRLLAMMRAIAAELVPVAQAYGCAAPDIERLIATGRLMGAAKTSMLQDLERGRPLELAAIGHSVLELAARQQMSMPITRTIIDLADHLDQKRICR